MTDVQSKQRSPVWSLVPADELSVLAGQWDAINRRGTNLPILDAAFYIAALANFGNGEELLAIAHADDGSAVAAGILVKRRPGVWATFQPSQAPLGAWLADSAVDSQLLWSGLRRALPGSCLLLGISQQDPRFNERPVDHACTRTLDYIDTASISVTGSFAEYWSQRGRNLRQNLKRQRNRLAREGRQLRLERIVAPDRIGAAVDDYGHLESQGWKAGKGTSLHPDNAQGRFYRAVFETLACGGGATVYRYWYDDILVASDLCVDRGGVFIILKTAHNETFSKTSPTHLMRQEYLEDLFAAEEIERIEFYGKLMDWHTKWSDDVRRMFHVNYYRWAIIPLIRDLAGGVAKNR